MDYFHEGLALARRIGNSDNIINYLSSMGELASEHGNDLQAESYTTEGLNLARQLHVDQWLIYMLDVRGEYHLAHNEGQAARKCYEELLGLLSKYAPDALQWAIAHWGMARVSVAEGDLQVARKYGEESLNILKLRNHFAQKQVSEWLASLPR